MNDLIPINVLIGDRTYRLKVNTDEEEQLRKTVKIINEKIIDFKTNFAGKDMQDYIAMVLIWYATQLSGNNTNPALENEVSEALLKIEGQLDKVL